MKNFGHSKKNEKRQYDYDFIITTHVLAKVHEEIMIFEEVRGHLVILLFYRAQTRDSEGPLRKRAIIFEVEVLDTPNFLRICISL